VADDLPGFSCAILAGGEGSRLRAEKALLDLGDRFLAETLIENLRPCFSDIMLVVRNEHSPVRALGEKGVRIVSDLLPRKGPLGGIHSALHHSENPFCFVIACDMPFPSLPLVGQMMRRADGHAAVVPRRGEYIEPLFAVYRNDLEEGARAFLESGRLKIHDFLDEVDVLYLEEEEIDRCDPHGLSFFNINTPEDLARAREIYLNGAR
jgi:molybdopterin-guanine dinucleotide biosynthesis protein A